MHEAYLRVFGERIVEWNDRAHFFAVAARQMRFILVDQARRRPQGGRFEVTLGDGTGHEAGCVVTTNEDLVALHEALERLAQRDPRAAQGVELRYFAGLTQQEIARIQGVDVVTVKRDWAFARSWLFNELSR